MSLFLGGGGGTGHTWMHADAPSSMLQCVASALSLSMRSEPSQPGSSVPYPGVTMKQCIPDGGPLLWPSIDCGLRRTPIEYEWSDHA